MSRKQKKITDDHLSEDETDAILGRAIQAKFDAELKQDLEESLRQDYDVTKSNQRIGLKERNNRSRLFYLAAIAASIAILVLAWNVFYTSSSGDVQELALAYLVTTEIYHGGALKGNTDNEEARMQAIRSFNAGEYEQAEQYFSNIEEKTEEDIFYSSISSLYNEQYTDAIAQLKRLTGSKSRYQAEANWYLAIAYILDGDLDAGKNLLSEMVPSSWNYDKTRKLLESFD